MTDVNGGPATSPAPAARDGAPLAAPRFTLPASITRLACVSDLHLGPHAPRTTRAFLEWLAGPALDAQVLCILGDLFEAWIGDDLLDAPPSELAAHPGLATAADDARQICRALREWTASGERTLYVQHGNRDFLLGPGFARQTGATLLPDPAILCLGAQPLLLTHGDQLCLADTAYLKFRAQVRQPAWQQAALATPLAGRLAQAAALRAASRAEQARAELWADADPDEALRWMTDSGCRWMIHGHTHRPRDHWGAGHLRQVLSDWDLDDAHPFGARGEALWIRAAGQTLTVCRAPV